MRSEKYSNGMYKSTNKAQDNTSMAIFKTLTDNPTHNGLEYMSVNFDQTSGICEYSFYFFNYKSVYYILVGRNGEIAESGFTTR